MVTLLYASLLALLLVYLAAKTIQARVKDNIALGDGGKEKSQMRPFGPCIYWAEPFSLAGFFMPMLLPGMKNIKAENCSQDYMYAAPV